jgi:hypothetical protein
MRHGTGHSRGGRDPLESGVQNLKVCVVFDPFLAWYGSALVIGLTMVQHVAGV